MDDIVSAETKLRLQHILESNMNLLDFSKAGNVECEDSKIQEIEFGELGDDAISRLVCPILESCELNMNIKEAALHTAGAAAMKTAKNISCSDCKDFLIIPESKGDLFDCNFENYLQRGGLVAPQKVVLQAFSVIDRTFRYILSDENDSFNTFQNSLNHVQFLSNLSREQTVLKGCKVNLSL